MEESTSCKWIKLICVFIQITKELYTALEPASQQKILSCLFDVCLDTDDLEVANVVRRCLKHVSILFEIFAAFSKKMYFFPFSPGIYFLSNIDSNSVISLFDIDLYFAF